MNKERHHGWRNYETWAVLLWLDNEEGSHHYWREATEEERERALEDPPRWAKMASFTARDLWVNGLADRLKDEHEEAAPDVGGLASDLLGAAMSEVDWREIAESLIEVWIEDRAYEKAQERKARSA